MNTYLVTTYNCYINLERKELVNSDSAENAILKIANRHVSWGTKNNQLSADLAERDNAHTQFNSDGKTGIYAKRV